MHVLSSSDKIEQLHCEQWYISSTVDCCVSVELQFTCRGPDLHFGHNRASHTTSELLRSGHDLHMQGRIGGDTLVGVNSR